MGLNGKTAGILLAATGAFATPLASTFAQRIQQPTAGWDVAGIRLGMDERRAEAVLRERGYAVQRKEPTPSFAERVQEAQGKTVRTSSSISELRGVKGQENVRVSFVQRPTGASVSGVTYNVPLGQVSGSDAVTMMTKRLGPPPAKRSRPGGAVWCRDGRNPRYCDPMAPSVEVSSYPGTGTSIVMQAGREVDMRAASEVSAAANAGGRGPRPSF